MHTRFELPVCISTHTGIHHRDTEAQRGTEGRNTWSRLLGLRTPDIDRQLVLVHPRAPVQQELPTSCASSRTSTTGTSHQYYRNLPPVLQELPTSTTGTSHQYN